MVYRFDTDVKDNNLTKMNLNTEESRDIHSAPYIAEKGGVKQNDFKRLW